MVEMSQQALPHMYVADEHAHVQTVRRDVARPGELVQYGRNLRYSAIVALGAAQLTEPQQQALFAGADVAQLIRALEKRGADAADLGAAALVGWATAEVLAEVPESVFDRISRDVKAGQPQPTVDYAWALTALLSARSLGEFDALAELAAERLLAAQGANGIFPHRLPRETLGRLRAHVGCYADQVYPIQALARYYAATGDARALAAANACAQQIVDLQGPAGQWWWHYDVRNGRVVEGYPVYSVHQHAMGPMALFDLQEAGGTDHGDAIARGLSWLDTHPETDSELLDPTTGAIWRKVGRREPRKAMRSVRAATTALSPGLRLGLLDRVLPPGVIDYECRPYEQGWLLYAWLSKPASTDRTAGK